MTNIHGTDVSSHVGTRAYHRPQTPEEDPLKPIALAYTAVRRAMTANGHLDTRAEGSVLAVSGAPVASLNAVISPNLDPDPSVIASLADSPALEGLAWTIQVRGLPGGRVKEVAAQHGLTHATALPLMVRRSEAGMPRPASGLRVRAVKSDELGLYVRTLADGFGVPREAFEIFADPALADTEGFTFYLAESDEVLVGTGMAAVHGDLLGVFNIGVLPQHRRRGYGKAITTEIVRAHHAAGATTAYLYASAMGESVYASAGFRTEEVLTMLSSSS